MINLLKRKPKHISLKLKINILIFVIMLSITFMVSSYLTYNAERKAVNLAKSYIKTIPSIIDSSINNFMTMGEKDVVKKLVYDLSNVENVVGIHIFNAYGDISFNFSHFNTENPNRYLNYVYKNFTYNEQTIEINDSSLKMLSYYKPYYNKPECKKCHLSDNKVIGVLNINVSINDLIRMLNIEVQAVNIIMFLSAIIISIVLSVLLNKLIITPLKKLEEGMKSVTENRLDTRVDIKSGDEFESISDYFNEMVVSLEDANKTINTMHNNIIHSDRLSTIGQLTAALSHEIKNPLNSIVIAGDILLMRLQKTKKTGEFDIDENVKHIDNIVSDAVRIKNIIDQTLKFSKVSTDQRQVVSIHSLIDSIVVYTRRILFNHERVSFKVGKGIDSQNCLLNINKTNIEQAFINILKNAFESIPEDRDDGEILFTVKISEDENNAIFIVKDNGVGIPHEQMQKICDEFFTTKTDGTGLGLPIAKELIEQHNGTLEIRSQVNMGTEVIVTLPLLKVNSKNI